MANNKMRMMLPVMAVSLTMLTACGKSSDTGLNIESVDGTDTVSSSVVSESIAGTATQSSSEQPESAVSGETDAQAGIVEPLPETLDVKNLGDCQVAVSFEPSDVTENDDGTLKIKFQVYDYELFDAVDISKLKVGDTIVVSGKDVKIDTMDRNDGGYIEINGGYEQQNGCSLSPEDGGTYCTTSSDDERDYKSIGTVTYDTSSDFKYIDQSQDPQAAGKEYDTAGFTSLLQTDKDDMSFYPYVARILLQDGKISNVTRVFVP